MRGLRGRVQVWREACWESGWDASRDVELSSNSFQKVQSNFFFPWSSAAVDGHVRLADFPGSGCWLGVGRGLELWSLDPPASSPGSECPWPGGSYSIASL